MTQLSMAVNETLHDCDTRYDSDATFRNCDETYHDCDTGCDECDGWVADLTHDEQQEDVPFAILGYNKWTIRKLKINFELFYFFLDSKMNAIMTNAMSVCNCKTFPLSLK
jgi:hypothetical protein